MGITGLNKMLKNYTVRNKVRRINVTVVDGNNIIYILSSRIRKRLSDTFVGHQQLAEVGTSAIISSLEDLALSEVTKLLEWMNNLSSKLIIVFDGFGHKDGYREFKKKEEEKRNEGKQKVLMNILDPLHKTSYKTVMEAVADYTKVVGTEIDQTNERKFITAFSSRESEINDKAYSYFRRYLPCKK